MQVENPSEICLTINPKRVAVFFCLSSVCLTIAHIAIRQAVIHLGFHHDTIIRWFNMDEESSIPTVFALFEWLSCIVLLGLIVLYKKNEGVRYSYWLGLWVIFIFLAMDEFLSIHEAISWNLHTTIRASGLFFHPWVIPYSVAFAVFSVVFLRFLLSLPAITRKLFVFAGSIFLSGALLTEAFAGKYVERFGQDAVYHLFFVSFEESLEMLGLSIFIYALSSYMVAELGMSQIRIGLGE